MKRCQLIAIIIFFSIILHAGADTPSRPGFVCRKRNFDTTAPLLHSHISNVQQDKIGFLWFATWNGLIRYDGHNFFPFKPITNSGGSIDSNRIYNIKMTTGGDIWCVSSDNRLFLFHTATGLFSNLSDRIPSMNGKKVKVLTPLKNGATWVTFKDYSCIRLSDSDPMADPRFYSADHPIFRDSRKINSITLDENGEEWILTDKAAVNYSKGYSIKGNCRSIYATPSSLLIIKPDGDFTLADREGNPRLKGALAPTPVTVTYTLRDGNDIFIGTDRGIWAIDINSGTPTCHTNLPVIYLAKDSAHRVWGFGNDCDIAMLSSAPRRHATILQATRADNRPPMKNPQLFLEDNDRNIILKPVNGNLSHYDEASGTLQTCVLQDNSGVSIYSASDIKKYLVDCDKNLWIFHAAGVDCLSFHPNRFNHTPNTLRQETRAMICDNDGRLWTADRSLAISISDPRSGTRSYLTPEGNLSRTHTTFSSMPVYAIRNSPDGDTWISTKGDGVYHLRPQRGDTYAVSHYRHNPGDPASIPSDSIYDIAFTGPTIWLASYGNGLLKATPDSNGSMSFSKVQGQPAGLKIRNISVSDNGTLILGTADGLITADISGKTPHRFHTNKFRAQEWGLKGNDIMALVKHNGHYYVCVYGSGVSRIDSDNLLSDSIRFTNFTIPATEATDQIKTAIAHNGTIWLVSEKALTAFDPATGLYNTHRGSDFIGSFSFSEATPAIAGDLIHVGTSEGTLSFNPDEINSPDHSRHIVVTGIRYQNDMDIHPLNDNDLISLNPTQRNFSLTLSSLEFDKETPSDFRYRLDGYDNGWNYTSSVQPSVTYNNLPPGDYRLIIESIGRDSTPDTLDRTIRISVRPRFSETVWFKISIILIIALIMAGMTYATIHFRHMRNLIQKKYSLLLRVDQLNRDFKSVATPQPPTSDRDEDFIVRSVEFLNANIDNPSLVIEDFARHLNMSRTAYYTRMKQITGLSPVDFIKQLRIKTALKLLDEGTLTIAEIAHRVGFSDPKYFSRCFKAEMEMTPTQYLERRSQSPTS